MDGSVILCSLLAFALYVNTFTAEFAYDDSRAILKNQDLLPETPLSHVFYDDFWGTPLTHSGSHKSYRPLCVLSFRLNHLLDGLRPRGYHVGNVLLHATVTGLFTHTARVLTGRSSVATAAGLLFASHPIHTEAVAGIVGRADILACLFFLLSFLGYLKYCKWRDLVATGWAMWKWAWLLWTAVCAVAALLCKEQGVTVLAVCAVYDVFIHSRLRVVDLPQVFFQKKYRGVQEGLLSLGVMAAAFVGFRVYFMGSEVPEFAPADNPAADSDSALTRTLTFLYLPVCNLWLLAYPRTLSFDWSMDAIPLVESCCDIRNVWTISLCAGLTYVTWLVFGVNQHHGKVKKPTSNGYANHCTASTVPATNSSAVVANKTNAHRRFVRCGSVSSTDSDDSTKYLRYRASLASLHIIIISLALLVFPFVPAMNLFFYVGFVIAERVLYIPSMGYCLLLAHGVYTLLRTQCDRTGGRKVVVGVFVGLVLVYSVRTVVRNHDWRSEENLYKAGISVNPAKAWGNLGNILNSNGRSSEAEQAYRAALQYRANMADVHYNLGILLQEQNRYEEAIESYLLALQCRPRLSMAYLNLGIIYAATEKKEEAEKMYRHCSGIDITGLKDPKLHEQTKISALYNLGRLLADQDRYREAIEIYEEAVAKRPSHYAPQSLYNMLGEAYSKLGQLESAEHWYRESLTVKPDHVPAFLTMGKLCQKRREIQSAMDWFLKAKTMAPKDASVYQHYGQFLGDLGRHQEAADSYVTAAKWAPDDFELIFNTANALRQAERNEDAEHYYQEAAKLRPKVATAHMNLGAILHYNGKLQEAETSYLAALALKPDDAVTQNNLQKLRNLMQKTHGGGGAS